MNYVGINRIVEQVYKSGLNTDEINFYDIIEWVGEAILKIGVQYAYLEKVTNGVGTMPAPIEVVDYKAALPVGIVSIQGVRDYDTKTALIAEAGSFRSWGGSNNLLPGESPMASYRVEDGYIYTNIEEATLEISYTAFATDSNGYPMIPDDERYISAVRAYVMYVIAYRLWLQDKLDDKKYQEIERNWLFYVKSAKTKAHMPDFDGMEALKNQMTKIINNPDHHASQFKYLSK